MQPNKGTVPKLVYRKTSAEIVSEARSSLLAGSGARLVSTRRPITPNVNKRQLYGNNGPAGRPPSAFNLKYLQYETRALPCLEPISQGVAGSSESFVQRKVERSGSVGTIPDISKTTRLPALLEPPTILTSESQDECRYNNIFM